MVFCGGTGMAATKAGFNLHDPFDSLPCHSALHRGPGERHTFLKNALAVKLARLHLASRLQPGDPLEIRMSLQFQYDHCRRGHAVEDMARPAGVADGGVQRVMIRS